MKFSISWHKESLRNQKIYYEDSRKSFEAEMQRRGLELDNFLLDVISYEEQIKEAQRLGKDGFDRERFLIKRKKSV